jgi:LysR family transcriptional activator of nhaA
VLGRDDVEIVLRSGAFPELLEALEAHRLDVLLANSPPPRDASTPWVTHTLGAQRVSLVGPPDQARPARDLRRILETEPVVLPGPHSSIREGFDALAERLGVRLRIAAEVDDMAMLRLVAREGLGVAVVPPIVVKDELEDGTLTEISRLEGLEETFLAVTLARRFPNPLLELLIRPELVPTSEPPADGPDRG